VNATHTLPRYEQQQLVWWDPSADYTRWFLETARLFSLPTRRYLRRRAWLYFRELGRNAPERYVPAVPHAPRGHKGGGGRGGAASTRCSTSAPRWRRTPTGGASVPGTRSRSWAPRRCT